MDTHRITCCGMQGRAAKRSRTAGASAAGPAVAHEDTGKSESDSDDSSGSEQDEVDEVDFEPEIVEDDRSNVKVRCTRHPAS